MRSGFTSPFRRRVFSARDDGGKTWKPIKRGLKSQYELPDPDAEVGHCVHRIALHPSRPDVLFMQKHWDVLRTDNAGEQWKEVSGNLPTDFGFPIDVHAHEPETIFVVPIKSDSEHYPPDGKLRVYRSKTGGNEWEAAHQRPAAEGLLRERAARRDGRGLARTVRRLFRHDRRPGLLLRPTAAIRGTPSSAICRRFIPSRCKRCNEIRNSNAEIRRKSELECRNALLAWVQRFGFRFRASSSEFGIRIL